MVTVNEANPGLNSKRKFGFSAYLKYQRNQPPLSSIGTMIITSLMRLAVCNGSYVFPSDNLQPFNFDLFKGISKVFKKRCPAVLLGCQKQSALSLIGTAVGLWKAPPLNGTIVRSLVSLTVGNSLFRKLRNDLYHTLYNNVFEIRPA